MFFLNNEAFFPEPLVLSYSIEVRCLFSPVARVTSGLREQRELCVTRSTAFSALEHRFRLDGNSTGIEVENEVSLVVESGTVIRTEMKVRSKIRTEAGVDNEIVIETESETGVRSGVKY
ncbi:hypothetical protein EVAR_68058_1 [Eumeta japonica]|uniref:Uncharacterized protein n=1 Tax=Eumeta variegata TaxID=151549 RepID=A0A4C1ZQ70_EUMVA|nr:hypothetical protein EVAR_68058_1 [Eumeta japonica]